MKIAAENMWNFIGGKTSPAACSDEVSFREHLDAVNDDYFVACVDIGHAEMAGLDTSAEKCSSRSAIKFSVCIFTITTGYTTATRFRFR